MKKKDIVTYIPIPIYNFRLKLVITKDMEKWDKMYPAEDNCVNRSPGEAMFVPTEGVGVVVVVRHDSPLYALQHEIGHAARYVMGYIGFKIHCDNDEPLAYLEGYLTEQIHDRIKSLTKPNSKRKVRSRRK